MQYIVAISILFFQGGLGDLIVQLQDGKVQGTTIETPSGKTFYAWRGIPFAKPPLGELRYQPPVRAESWEGILDASQDSSGCVFFGLFPPDPSGNTEDCLYINVYSPVPAGANSSINSSLPVMFWIYGGGFFAGSAHFSFYDPTPLLEENVIIVTFNYRIGVLGFLSTQDDVILGNAGLKDQLLALQWTNGNIAAFGGNPQDITIFGESAGAISAGYLIVSPLSRGLFKRAIMESGSALYFIIYPNAKDYAYTLANRIDSSITNASTSEQVRDVLQTASVDDLLNLTQGERVYPTLEIESDISLLTDPVYEILKSGDIARVPMIIGFNSEESLGFLPTNLTGLKDLATQYDLNQQLLVPKLMPLRDNVSAVSVGEEIHQKYLGKDGLFSENLAIFLEWYSDNMYIRSSTKHAVLQSSFASVYMYQFSFYGTTSQDTLIVPGAGKVAHAQEVAYLFNESMVPLQTEKDYLTRRRLVKLWTNFAKTSNPTPDDDSAELLQNVKWEPIIADNISYLDIDEDLEIKPSRKVNEIAFFDYIWETYSYHPYNTY